MIDDDPRNIFALTAVLRAKGYSVLAAGGMREGFEKLDQHENVGIILLDMMMPDMDGYEALDKLKQHALYAQLPVIAVTAQAMSGDREKCLAAGANAYLSKPVDIDLLEGLLQQIG